MSCFHGGRYLLKLKNFHLHSSLFLTTLSLRTLRNSGIATTKFTARHILSLLENFRRCLSTSKIFFWYFSVRFIMGVGRQRTFQSNLLSLDSVQKNNFTEKIVYGMVGGKQLLVYYLFDNNRSEGRVVHLFPDGGGDFLPNNGTCDMNSNKGK